MVATIDQDIRDSAYRIIEAKKSTYYGIGHVVAMIVEAMTHKRGSIFPVCSLAEGEYGLDRVVVGLPSLVNSKGAQIVEGYPLSENEAGRLRASAKIVRDAIKSVSSEVVK